MKSEKSMAYLIGGPYDLTKMAVERKKRVIRMAEPVEMPHKFEDDAKNESITIDYIEYELVGTAFKHRYTGDEVSIYVYKGVLDA